MQRFPFFSLFCPVDESEARLFTSGFLRVGTRWKRSLRLQGGYNRIFITIFGLRRFGECFFFYILEKGREGVHTAHRWITARFTTVHKTRNSRVCAPPAGVKLAKPKRISSDLHNPTKYQDTIKINIYSDASSIRTRFSNKLEAKRGKKQIF